MSTPTRTADDRVWLITGTSSGFGRAIAEAALAAGDTVVATARRPEDLDDLVKAFPDRAVAMALDVTDPARIGDVVADVLLRYGRIDVLVNNAGRAHVGAVEETTDRELRDIMELQFFGPATLTRAVLPHMRRRESGAIVQMSSMGGGRLAFPGLGAYAASKFALAGLSRALGEEVAPLGIKVLVVEPGSFRTGLAGAALTQSAAIPAYDPTVGVIRTHFPAGDGKQPGDPAKAAAAILAALAADEPPSRLPLGNDAADMLSGELDAARAEFRAWEEVARGTDLSQSY